MTNPIPYIVQGDNIVLMIDNQSHNISRCTHMNYNRILDAIQNGDWEKVRELADMKESVTNYADGLLEIKDGEMFWDGRLFHNAMSTRLLQMYEQGFSIEPMKNFLTNLVRNPSYRAVEELYGFMENNSLPITPEGNFLAYKRVKENDNGQLVDCYTGTFNNNVGEFVQMERNTVDDDRDHTCSMGLHFCSLEYLSNSGYGSHSNPIVIVEINPKDVVSIPSDYNNQKGRCCGYTVVGLHGTNDTEEAFTDVVDDSYTIEMNEDFEAELARDTFEDDGYDIDGTDNPNVSLFKPPKGTLN